MKIMSRDFTRTEKILLAVLALILLGLAYYQFVDKAVRATINNANSEAEMLQKELSTMEDRIAYLKSLQSAMDELEANNNLSWMGSYNNSKAEVAFLNDILADATKYSVTFADVTRNGDQIRRSFTLQYQTESYAAAQAILDRLSSGRNRCIIGDTRCAINDDGSVTISQSATFFETMAGGVADAGLPADRGAAKQ